MATSDDEITHYRQYLESNTLGVGDMPDPAQDWTVRIEKVSGGSVAYSNGPSRKAMISFVGVKKKYAAGAQFMEAIRDLYGTPNPKKWYGKLITLYATTCDAFGSKKDCIRVRNVKPKDDAPQPESSKTPFDLEALIHAVKTCSSTNSLNSLKPKSVPKSVSEEDRARLKAAFAERMAHLEKVEAEADEMERAAFDDDEASAS